MMMFVMTTYVERAGAGMRYYGYVRDAGRAKRPTDCAYCDEPPATGGCLSAAEAHFCSGNPNSGFQISPD